MPRHSRGKGPLKGGSNRPNPKLATMTATSPEEVMRRHTQHQRELAAQNAQTQETASSAESSSPTYLNLH